MYIDNNSCMIPNNLYRNLQYMRSDKFQHRKPYNPCMKLNNCLCIKRHTQQSNCRTLRMWRCCYS